MEFLYDSIRFLCLQNRGRFYRERGNSCYARKWETYFLKQNSLRASACRDTPGTTTRASRSPGSCPSICTSTSMPGTVLETRCTSLNKPGTAPGIRHVSGHASGHEPYSISFPER